ncbi:Manganese-dependent 2,3-dihydroxybiphenyl 1,2-dioxygenase (plasmid) [Nitratireductor thuwali]|uniref:Manganese-dependent 2,3-dihydroxybiphenyl 1,2-dioxygenase n=1 Tax=Nitratireductor thuwali TaxID=2267699 RepID=A0ABY5MTD7_9HYPH|nr:Manganese-dependent 2,3-dihydroxybiphenyl 1,2-dioxygenase [Nitratireductor thuwali]
MPLPSANLYPPFNIVRLSHADLTVTDLSRSRAFYAETIGLQITDEDDDTIYFRGLEERTHHCLILRKGDAPSADALGFRVYDEEDLDRAEVHFSKQGRDVSWIERPFQGRTLHTTCPLGIPLEFHARMDRLPPIHQKYDLYKGVRPLRIDHVNCFSSDVATSISFFGELGFRVTEYTEDEATKNVWAAWMHRKGGSTTSPLPMASAHGSTMSHSGCRRRWQSSTCSISWRQRDAWVTSSADRGGTGCRTRSSFMYAIRTGIASSSIARITSLSIRILNRSNGI